MLAQSIVALDAIFETAESGYAESLRCRSLLNRQIAVVLHGLIDLDVLVHLLRGHVGFVPGTFILLNQVHYCGYGRTGVFRGRCRTGPARDCDNDEAGGEQAGHTTQEWGQASGCVVRWHLGLILTRITG